MKASWSGLFGGVLIANRAANKEEQYNDNGDADNRVGDSGVLVDSVGDTVVVLTEGKAQHDKYGIPDSGANGGPDGEFPQWHAANTRRDGNQGANTGDKAAEKD